MILQPAGYVSLVRDTYTGLAANHISAAKFSIIARKNAL